jgi:hypothetical protein
MCLNLPFRGPLLPLIQGISSAVPGDLAEGYLLLGVRVHMALHAVAMAPNGGYLKPVWKKPRWEGGYASWTCR